MISGTVTSHGQTQTILSSYNIQPQLRTVNARGAVLSRVAEDDLMDHIGFPVPELPARRVGKGDRWLEPVVVPLNWDEFHAGQRHRRVQPGGVRVAEQLPDRQDPRDLQRPGPVHLAAVHRQRPRLPAADQRLADHL